MGKFSYQLANYLEGFSFEEKPSLFPDKKTTQKDAILINGKSYIRFINEFWTSKQRQGNSLHEVAYRACFKPQLPNFFINLLTKNGDVVYDPFSGRGTTAIEAGLLGRNVIANDINPLSKILCLPRFFIPTANEIDARLSKISIVSGAKADIDLSMFFHPKTEEELVSLRNYLLSKKDCEDRLDMWIRMVATNRLTGHSAGYFSVYTLPPNQAVSPESQIKINQKRNQRPEYRNTREIILKKTRSLIKDLSLKDKDMLQDIGSQAMFLSGDARYSGKIPNGSVRLTVTSPPFLDVVQYSNDNWLRCWFNSINDKEIVKKITVLESLSEWICVMEDVLAELFRVTRPGGWVAFEVGEVRNGSIRLDESIIPIGVRAGFSCLGVLINRQEFTKTSNIWGIKNNTKGTNTNRVVLFSK